MKALLSSTTPPLEEREAVARTWNEIRSRYVIYCNIAGNTPAKLWLDKESATEPVFVGPVDDCEARMDLAASDAIIAQHIEPLRTKNETLRAERDAAREDTSVAIGQLQDEIQLRARMLQIALKAEADRDAAIARSEEAKIARADALAGIARLTAKLAQAEGKIATMRAALVAAEDALHDASCGLSFNDAEGRQNAGQALRDLRNAIARFKEHPHGD